MAYSNNILPKEAAYYTLTNATLIDGRLSIKAGGTAKINIDNTLLSTITDSILVNVYVDKLLNPFKTDVIMFLDIVLEDDTTQCLGIYPNQLEDKALSFPIELKDGAYKSCELCIQANIDCDLIIYELCPKQDGDVTTIIDGVKQSLPHVLYDYNEVEINIEQAESTIAMIACSLQGNTDVNGHFLMNFYSIEQCDIFLRFYDNEIEELYTPLKYTISPGYNSIGVPHAYLKRLAGFHNFVVTCQCTNGKLTMYTRDILFTIDAGYLAERLIDIGMNVRDITCKHVTLSQKPEEIWAIGIDAKEVIVKKREFITEASTTWTPLYSFPYYEKMAIEFNGSWQKVPKQLAYTIITEEQPYIFIIDSIKNLYCWLGNDIDNKILLDSNVTEVHALRGYNSIVYPEQDQGLICAYLKEGKIYYRALVYLNDTYAWSMSTILCEEEQDIIEFSMHRLNDYRIGIAYATVNKNYWAITDRTYVNQAVPTEEEEIESYVYKSLSSMTPSTASLNGRPCVFEDPTEPQQEFTITYDLPLKHFIDDFDLDERLHQLFKMTLNGVVPEGYSIIFDNNVLRILLKTPAESTRASNCNIKLSIINPLQEVIFSTSNNGHGVPIIAETFSWVIERPITTINSSSITEDTINPNISSYSSYMRPLNKVISYNSEYPEIKGIISDSTFSMKPLNYIKNNVNTPVTISPSLDEVSLQCVQTGVKPV